MTPAAMRMWTVLRTLLPEALWKKVQVTPDGKYDFSRCSDDEVIAIRRVTREAGRARGFAMPPECEPILYPPEATKPTLALVKDKGKVH